MDLFGPTSIRSIDQKYYSLVVTDDYSRFSWAFFLGTKDETFYILKDFLALIENQLNKKVKAIRCDNRTEFHNAKLIDLCRAKGIRRDCSNARTPQQNRVAERKNRTLIEAARSMLADSKLPTMFWTEAVSTANGNSFNPVSRITANAYGTSTSTISGLVTAEEKAQKKNDENLEACYLEQIHEDDLEEMDLKWQLALLSMRARRCVTKRIVFFTKTECLILSPDFKLSDENQVLLKVPRKNNMYSFDLKNVVPSMVLTCLFTKAINDESNLWHRRMGHINFKTMNKLVKENLVRGLPSKIFENDHTCVACQKRKQHKASCKSKLVNSVSQPLQILHMDLFGPTFIKSIMGKMYCLVVTDDYSRTEFKNYEMNQFCGIKRIKKEFSNARTPQQNGVAERKNRTLIEAARTMLADSLLTISFWAEAVNTACYVQNMFYETFCCPVTILNTLDDLGKFDGKVDEGFLVGYSINSKDFRVYNRRTKKVEENLHVNFLKNKPNVVGSGLEWLFDIDSLTNLMNYQLVSVGNRTNVNASSSSFSHPAILDDFSKMSNLEDTKFFDDAYDDRNEGAKADYNNLETGHSQEEGIDYDEVFASVVRIEAIRPDIMFAVCACSRFQVQPKVSHMHVVKRIFRYLKSHPTLGLWYPKDSPLELIANSNSDYAGASLDRKSTTGGCQFLVYHSKTKHIEIRHHFIRDSYEKRLIEMVKIHTDSNVTDLLTKAFDVTRFHFLVASIGIELKGYLLNDGYADLVQHAGDSVNTFVDQHNMVAYLEKSDDNTELHQIVDFLSSCTITYTLALSPTIYASYIEQFWNTVSSKTVNSMKQIHAIVDGKVVVISESLVRSDLFFDDEDGNVTPLFDTMLVQHEAAEGKGSAIPPEPQPIPSTSQQPTSTQTRKRTQKDNELPQTSVPLNHRADEALNQEEGDRVERAITTDASLEAAQDSDNIAKTQTTVMPNVDIPRGINIGGRPRRQETIGGTSAQTRFERVLEWPNEPPRFERVLERPNEPPLTEGHTFRSVEGKLEENIKLTDTVPTPHDSLLTGGYIPGNDEGRIPLAELMET
uniref:Integrase catalytic domain-containing protein n=1 Tax=Tanacetum cinerariifolium TaxID=118510 RepID=A0A6L2LPY6_TANCI|nr:hypothetical protein [Tanacetum cinerariifolium]